MLPNRKKGPPLSGTGPRKSLDLAISDVVISDHQIAESPNRRIDQSSVD